MAPSRGKPILYTIYFLITTEQWPVQKQLQGLDETPD